MTVVTKPQVLGFLARNDPAAALGELPPMGLRDPNDKSYRTGVLLSNQSLTARIRFATMLLGVDLDQGLEALLEVARNNPHR